MSAVHLFRIFCIILCSFLLNSHSRTQPACKVSFSLVLQHKVARLRGHISFSVPSMWPGTYVDQIFYIFTRLSQIFKMFTDLMKNTPLSLVDFVKQCEMKVQSCFLGDFTPLQAQRSFAVIIFLVKFLKRWHHLFSEPSGRRAARLIQSCQRLKWTVLSGNLPNAELCVLIITHFPAHFVIAIYC